MPGTDFIPANDHSFLAWAQAFSTNLNLTPAAYMMSVAEAQSVADVVSDFQEKLAIATNEATRTKGTIAAKDDARSIAESLCRDYAALIKVNKGIDDQKKIDAGVRPENPDRENIDPPGTSPLLNILGNTPGVQTIRYADSSTPDKAAKPYGYSQLQLFLAVRTGAGEAPLSECQFQGAYTRNPIEVVFAEEDDKKTATYYARWTNGKGQAGPWSLPVTMAIAA